MPTLDEIALKFGTDKGSTGHNYCPIYEQLFGHLREAPIDLLELGIYHGASLNMWAEYFEHCAARVTGIDINPFESDHESIFTFCGDQAEIPNDLDWYLDIIIDDASHLSAKTIESFKTWWPRLKPGGFYVVEDISATYYYGLSPAMRWFQNVSNQVHVWKLPSRMNMGYEVASVTFHPDLVIVEKKK